MFKSHQKTTQYNSATTDIEQILNNKKKICINNKLELHKNYQMHKKTGKKTLIKN